MESVQTRKHATSPPLSEARISSHSDGAPAQCRDGWCDTAPFEKKPAFGSNATVISANAMRHHTQDVTPIAEACGCGQPALRADRETRRSKRKSPPERRSTLMKDVILRATPPDPTWLLRYIKPSTGTITHKTLGRLSTMTEFEACVKAREFLAILEAGGDPLAGDMTVEAYFDERRLPWAQANKKSWKDDLGVFNRYVRRKIGKLVMKKVTRRHLQLLIDALLEGAEPTDRREKISKGTVYQVIAHLKAHFNWAFRNGDIAANPAATIRQLKLNNQRRERYTAEQLAVIGVHLRDAPPLVRLLFVLLLALGARIGELLNAKHDDVDERGCTLYIGQNKADRPIRLPMPPMAMVAYEELKTLRRPGNPYLLPANGGSGPMAPPRKAFKKVLEAAGIENRTFHDARRTTCSTALECPGVTLVDASRALNHSSVRVTESRYLVTGDERIRNALTQASDRLNGHLTAAL